jgi:phage tail sheath protein FI
MPEYLAPGVFVEEIDSGSKPIEGVGTSTAAFIGYAKSGDFNRPTFITNWSQFCQIFGEEENLILTSLQKELGISATDALAGKKLSRKGWIDYARTVFEEARTGAGKKAPTSKNWPEFLKKNGISQAPTAYIEGVYLAHAVRGYFDNGGRRAYIIRIPRVEDAAQFAVGSDGASAIPASAARGILGAFAATAARPGREGNDIKVDVEHVGEADEFRLKIQLGDKEEVFGGGRDKPLTPSSAVAAVNAKSKLVVLEATATELSRPPLGVLQLADGTDASSLPATATATTALSVPGLDGISELTPDDFIGDEARRTGMAGMAVIDDVNAVCIPDIMAGVWKRSTIPGIALGPEALDLDDRRRQAILDAQCSLVAYCERMGDRMAILDPIPALKPQEIRDLTLNTPFNSERGQAALYYPWIKIPDPLHRGEHLFVPPCGHIAGVWARVDTERGVHKAPANEVLRGAVALEVDITKGEQEILNPEGINCIRAFPGTGIRIWGARTLATVGNPSWKYVNVRRLFNYLEKSIERGMQWVVFEPNDQDLWGRVRRNLSAFLYTEWKESKLFGTIPEEAFYVKCDAETNPQEMIDLGRLYVEIGVNPVKPAEFVIIRIGQWSGGSSVAEQ